MRTYYVYMNITLSVDDAVIEEARRRAEKLGTSVNQLVREYLENFVNQSDAARDAEEFERLSRTSGGNSHGWKFNRDEIYDERLGILRHEHPTVRR